MQPFQLLLEQVLGRPFSDAELLRSALTHSSFYEGRGGEDNERLEFLGDRVLGLVVADHLYRNFPGWREDELAPRFNSIVNKQACAKAARSAGIGEAVRLSRAEAEQGGRFKDSILADAAEAVVAALYLEGGLTAARVFIEQHWAESLATVADAVREPKMALQEWAAAKRLGPPQYTVSGRSGPDHSPTFTVQVVVVGAGEAVGVGSSKREAERLAAAQLLEKVCPNG